MILNMMMILIIPSSIIMLVNLSVTALISMIAAIATITMIVMLMFAMAMILIMASTLTIIHIPIRIPTRVRCSPSKRTLAPTELTFESPRS